MSIIVKTEVNLDDFDGDWHLTVVEFVEEETRRAIQAVVQQEINNSTALRQLIREELRRKLREGISAELNG